jgi:hypothetical protein
MKESPVLFDSTVDDHRTDMTQANSVNLVEAPTVPSARFLFVPLVWTPN